MEKDQVIVSLISGGAAGTATDIAFFPIDTLKTRLQAKGGFFQNGGWKGVYRGLGSAVVASAPSSALFFVTYDSCKVFFKGYLKPYFHNEDNLLHVTHIISGSLGEIMACLFRVPAEVVKQRTQASHFKSSLEAFKFLLKDQNNEGLIRGFYRGWNTTILREIPFTSIQYPLYEFLKKKWAFYEENNKISPLQGATCGSIAGGTAAALTTPLDVLKTRIMLHKERIGLVALTKNLIKEEGFKSLLNGMVPRILWISAGGFIYLGMYETVHFILTERNEINKKLQ